MTQASVLAQLGSAGVSQGFKNRIINGAMVIDQRNAGAEVSPAPTGYGLDRWATYKSGSGTWKIQQSTDAPTGFANSALLTVTATSTPSGNDYYIFLQAIEGFNTADLAWGTASAQSVTLSFWVKSSVTGTFGGALRNSAENRTYPFTFAISSANTWEQKSVTIAGDTSGTWLTNNGRGITLTFSLGGAGTSLSTANAWSASGASGASGQTNWISNSGATFYITGVQLEVGTTATEFEVRPYGTELSLCQRYYRKGKARMWSAVFESTTSILAVGVFGTTMRAAPTITRLTNSTWGSQPGNNENTSAFGFASSSVDGASFAVASDTSRTLGLPATCATNDFVDFSAEL